jgi:hypothetical protein
VLVVGAVLATTLGVVAPPASVAVTNVMVTGVLVDAEGAPMSGAMVTTWGAPATDTTDAAGAFAVTVQAGQSVRLQVNPGPYDLPVGAPRPQAGSIRVESSSFTPTEDLELGTVTMPPMAGTRTLAVVDRDGTPVYGAWVDGVSLGTDWLDAGHQLADGLVVESAYYAVHRMTDADGRVVFTAPRMVGGALPEIPISIHSSTGGGQYVASSSDAVGTDPPTVTISGYEVGAPTAPADVWASSYPTQLEDGSFSVKVYWTGSQHNGTPVTGYTVTAQPGGMTAWLAPDKVPQATVTGLTGGETYTFTVTANSAAGGTSSAATPPMLVAGPPGRPENLTAVPGDQKLTFTWGAPSANGSPITGYRVWFADRAPLDLPADQTSVTFDGLVNGTEYDIEVMALNAKGGGISAWLGGATPVAAPAPTQPVVQPPPTTTAPLAPAVTTFVVSVAPKVAGKALVGRVLKAKVGTTTPSATSVRLQWLRNGKVIKRATKAKYRLTAKDRRKKISLRVTYRRAGMDDLVVTTKRLRVR